jgi:hypothetical protein
MWYRFSEPKSENTIEQKSVDLQFIELLAENMIRNRFFYKGAYNPNPIQIKQALNRVKNSLQEKYGDLNTLRNKTNSEQLTPLLKSVIDRVVR